MWNPYKVFYSQLFCFLAICFSGSAHAVTAPTTITQQGGNFNSDHLAACLSMSSQFSGTPINTTSSGGYFQKTIGGVDYSFKPQAGTWKQCVYYTGNPVGGTFVGGYYFCQGATYPDATNSCASCPPGYTNIGGVCQVAPTCPAAGTKRVPTLAGGGFFVSFSSGVLDTGMSGSTYCSDGCAGKCTAGFTGPNPVASGYAAVCTELTMTGGDCPGTSPPMNMQLENPLEVEPETDPDADGKPEGPNDCPPGTGYAEINGKSSCLPSGTSGTGSSTTQTGSGGDTSNSESEWEILPGGQTQTTTTTTSSSGGNTSTTTTTNTPGINGVDGKDGKDAKDIDFGPPPTFDTSLPAEDGLPVGPELQPFTPDFNMFGGGFTCPAPIPVDVLGVVTEFSFQPACDIAPAIKSLFLIVCSAFSIRILFS